MAMPQIEVPVALRVTQVKIADNPCATQRDGQFMDRVLDITTQQQESDQTATDAIAVVLFGRAQRIAPLIALSPARDARSAIGDQLQFKGA